MKGFSLIIFVLLLSFQICPEISYASLDSELFEAVENVDFNKVADLVNKGANINVKHQKGQPGGPGPSWTPEGGTVLMRVASQDKAILKTVGTVKGKNNVINENIKIAKLLIEKGARINTRMEGGHTALMLAVNSDQEEIAKLLVEKGADINAEADDGATALSRSTKRCRVEIARFLIKNGANLNARNNKGETVLFAAIGCGQGPGEFNKRAEFVKMLLENQADINAKGNFGQTPLIEAANMDEIEIAKILIEKGADVNAKVTNGATALMVAAGEGNIEIVKLLIRNGADVNAKMENGFNAMMAAKDGLKDYTDRNKDNPLLKDMLIKKQKNYSLVIQLLKQAGAQK